MSLIQSPIIGASKKSAGGMVFTRTGGRNIMRTKPFNVKVSNNDVSLNARSVFGTLIKSLTPFLVPTIIGGLIMYPKKAYRTIVNQVMALISGLLVYDQVTGWTIAPEKMTIGGNPLMSYKPETVTCVAGLCSVTWDKDQGVIPSGDDVKIFPHIFIPEINHFAPLGDNTGIAVATEVATLQAPDYFPVGAKFTIFLFTGVAPATFKREEKYHTGWTDRPDMVGGAGLESAITAIA